MSFAEQIMVGGISSLMGITIFCTLVWGLEAIRDKLRTKRKLNAMAKR
jgi:Na+/H+ antiporter NhaC